MMRIIKIERIGNFYRASLVNDEVVAGSESNCAGVDGSDVKAVFLWAVDNADVVHAPLLDVARLHSNKQK